jgi:hypothetical protein
MRTPNGAECPFFYGNYFRGRKQEECRLIGEQPPPDQWTPDLCKTCPVPGISRANACPNMVLHANVEARFLGLRHKVRITAICNFTHGLVSEPEIGCGHCHELPAILTDEEK